MTYWLKTSEERQAEKDLEKNFQAVLKQFDENEKVKDRFTQYLKENENGVIRLDGYNQETEDFEVLYLPILHRWKKEYKKRVLAKTYKINDWYKKNKQPVTLITFTTRQQGLKIPDQIDLLKDSFNKIKKIMNKLFGRFPYIWVMEPHKSGYAHIHMLYFGKRLSKNNKDRIKDLWEKKYNAGTQLDFAYSKTQRSLNNAGGYVFKYIAKTLDFDLLKDRETGYYMLSSWVREMSKRDTHYRGVRFWGASKDITAAMQADYEPRPVIWFRTNIKRTDKSTKKVSWFPVWVSPDLECDDNNTTLNNFEKWLPTWWQALADSIHAFD